MRTFSLASVCPSVPLLGVSVDESFIVWAEIFLPGVCSSTSKCQLYGREQCLNPHGWFWCVPPPCGVALAFRVYPVCLRSCERRKLRDINSLILERDTVAVAVLASFRDLVSRALCDRYGIANSCSSQPRQPWCNAAVAGLGNVYRQSPGKFAWFL